jgi:hypothetical protein
MSAWDDIIYRLESAGQKIDIEHRKDKQVDDVGTEIVSEVDFIDFSLAGKDYRVEKVVRPLILDKKSHYSHTAGTKGKIQYILSPNETTTTLKAYVFDEDIDDYIEISGGGGFLG